MPRIPASSLHPAPERWRELRQQGSLGAASPAKESPSGGSLLAGARLALEAAGAPHPQPLADFILRTGVQHSAWHVGAVRPGANALAHAGGPGTGFVASVLTVGVALKSTERGRCEHAFRVITRLLRARLHRRAQDFLRMLDASLKARLPTRAPRLDSLPLHRGLDRMQLLVATSACVVVQALEDFACPRPAPGESMGGVTPGIVEAGEALQSGAMESAERLSNELARAMEAFTNDRHLDYAAAGGLKALGDDLANFLAVLPRSCVQGVPRAYAAGLAEFAKSLSIAFDPGRRAFAEVSPASASSRVLACALDVLGQARSAIGEGDERAVAQRSCVAPELLLELGRSRGDRMG